MRILAVADTVEAMTSHRPYRPAIGREKALAEIAKGRDLLYDADAVDACLQLFREERFRFEWRRAGSASKKGPATAGPLFVDGPSGGPACDGLRPWLASGSSS